MVVQNKVAPVKAPRQIVSAICRQRNTAGLVYYKQFPSFTNNKSTFTSASALTDEITDCWPTFNEAHSFSFSSNRNPGYHSNNNIHFGGSYNSPCYHGNDFIFYRCRNDEKYRSNYSKKGTNKPFIARKLNSNPQMRPTSWEKFDKNDTNIAFCKKSDKLSSENFIRNPNWQNVTRNLVYLSGKPNNISTLHPQRENEYNNSHLTTDRVIPFCQNKAAQAQQKSPNYVMHKSKEAVPEKICVANQNMRNLQSFPKILKKTRKENNSKYLTGSISTKSPNTISTTLPLVYKSKSQDNALIPISIKAISPVHFADSILSAVSYDLDQASYICQTKMLYSDYVEKSFLRLTMENGRPKEEQQAYTNTTTSSATESLLPHIIPPSLSPRTLTSIWPELPVTEKRGHVSHETNIPVPSFFKREVQADETKTEMGKGPHYNIQMKNKEKLVRFSSINKTHKIVPFLAETSTSSM